MMSEGVRMHKVIIDLVELTDERDAALVEVEKLKGELTRVYRALTEITTKILYPREAYSSGVMIIDPNSPLGKVWQDDPPCCVEGKCVCEAERGD